MLNTNHCQKSQLGQLVLYLSWRQLTTCLKYLSTIIIENASRLNKKPNHLIIFCTI